MTILLIQVEIDCEVEDDGEYAVILSAINNSREDIVSSSIEDVQEE